MLCRGVQPPAAVRLSILRHELPSDIHTGVILGTLSEAGWELLFNASLTRLFKQVTRDCPPSGPCGPLPPTLSIQIPCWENFGSCLATSEAWMRPKNEF